LDAGYEVEGFAEGVGVGFIRGGAFGEEGEGCGGANG